MKGILIIIRWVVGLLFIFSGLIKANDPLGLSYKMQEFFEAWNLNGLNDYTLALSLIMNVFEVLAGVAIIVGWGMRLFSWLLLLLIIFFSFLTGYALLSGKIKTCGCFGDCLPLTPLQSFLKDIGLLLLIIILFINKNKIQPVFNSKVIAPVILLISVAGVSFLQKYVLSYLPVVDCLPYKAGNNILQQMQIPEGAIGDSFAITFKYKKNGKEVEFDGNNFPADFDSSYEYVDRYDKLVRKGNAIAAISDFSLKTLSGTDTTEAILNQQNAYLLVFAQNFNEWDKQKETFAKTRAICASKNIPVFIVTSSTEQAVAKFDEATLIIVGCDATVIKTAARVNATYFIMQQANVLAKYSYASANNIERYLTNLPGKEKKLQEITDTVQQPVSVDTAPNKKTLADTSKKMKWLKKHRLKLSQ